MLNFIKDQVRTIKRKDPAIKSTMEVFLYPSFRALLCHRISNFLFRYKLYFLARFICEFAKRRTGIEIHPGAKIGKSVFIDHGSGVVIGETAVVGNNVTMFHGVTLGGTGNEKTKKRHPTIEDDVFIGSGAKVLGNIVIGKASKVGAGAIVLNNVPPGVTVVGVPAKIVRKR